LLDTISPPTSTTHWRRSVRAAVWVLTFAAAGLLALAITTQVRRGRALERGAREAAHAQASDAVRVIDAELQRVMPVATALADDLSAGRLKPHDVSARVTGDLTGHPEVFEVGVAYLPFASDPRVTLFAPHASRASGRVEPFQLETRYDYTKYEWFTGGLKGAGWGEPYFGAATGKLVVGYNVPFFRPGDASKTPIGVARVNFSLEDIRALVSRVSLGQTGYGFMLSRTGVYMSYPDESYVRRRRSAFDVARERNTPGRIPIYERSLRGESTENLTYSGATGRLVWLLMEPVKTTGWVFGVDFFTDEVSLDAQGVRRGFVRIVFAALLLAFAAALLAFHVERGGPQVLWGSAIALSVILLTAIGATWGLTMRYPDRNGETSVHILDEAAMYKFITAHLEKDMHEAPLQIPVGVLVRTVRFVDASDLVVSGTIWQRIPVARRGEAQPGIEMPDAEVFDLKDPVTTQQGDTDVTSWTFRATLREPSVWSQKYPFDRALVRFRILPRPSAVRVILVPALSSYELLMPSALPGIDKSIVLPGWDMDHSYFSYVAQNTQTSAAAPVSLSGLLPYDLSFNLVTQRQFLDPFVSSILPIIVIACLLFGLLIVGSKNNQKVSATGFRATDVLRASVSLLFPALVAQVNLRSKIGGNEIIYIEYFYFILYVAILGVSANALTFTLGARGVSQVRDNLIPKLLFWPAILGACFAVTLVFLY
jgi:hypothetical protein